VPLARLHAAAAADPVGMLGERMWPT
jgi:hypothetical protein